MILVLALLAPTAVAMSGKPRGVYPKSWEIFVLPQERTLEFAIFPNTTGLKHSYDLADEHRQARGIEELERHLAKLPKARWISFQYYDVSLDEGAGTVLRGQLEHTCERLRRACVFAL